MASFRPEGLWRYAFSIGATAVAAVATWLLLPFQDTPTPLFVLAVLVSAWYGGSGPAALAAVLSVLSVDYFFVEPLNSVDLNVAFFERSVIFGLILAVVIWFANWRKQAESKLREQTERLQEQACVLQVAQEDLKRADRMKDEFLAVLSHELRNPLGAIRNGLYLLADERLKDPRRIHEMMERQLNQLLRLMEDLLDVSRITSGKVVLQKESVELSDLVRDAVDLSRPTVEPMEHELTVALPPEPVLLEGDRVRLAQVLSNILNNAAKFTPPRGRIALHAATTNGTVEIRIRDNGIGIPADMVDRVFEMFTQGDRSVSRQQGGLGIGLSLARGLVEAHGGTVSARSEGPGKGSEIVVRLPAEAGVPAL